MREVKFRMFLDGKMHYPPFDFWMHDGEFRSLLEGIAITKKSDGGVYEVNGHIMQWTGLEDKNGNLIYEGDILRWRGWNLLSRTRYTAVGQVVFEKGCFITRTAEDEDDPDTGEYLWKHFEEGYKDFKAEVEIIGNIYEDPELLK